MNVCLSLLEFPSRNSLRLKFLRPEKMRNASFLQLRWKVPELCLNIITVSVLSDRSVPHQLRNRFEMTTTRACKHCEHINRHEREVSEHTTHELNEFCLSLIDLTLRSSIMRLWLSSPQLGVKVHNIELKCQCRAAL